MGRTRLMAALLPLAICAVAHGAARGAAGATPTDRFRDRPLTAPNEDLGSGGGVHTQASGPSVSRIVYSLGGVAVLIVGLGWAWKKMLAAQQAKGPEGVTLLSRSFLTPRHQVLIVRVGRRLLVVGDSGHGMNLLCEVTDAADAAALLGEAEASLESGLEDSYAGVLGLGTDLQPEGSVRETEPLGSPRSLEAARNDVRSLIERVRGLSRQVAQAGPESGMSRIES